MNTYDLIIVGSGSGLMVLETALSTGLRCAMIEQSKFGGTCLTKGCIPSKMLVHPADLIRETQEAGRIGLPYAQPEPDWAKVAGRMWHQIRYSEKIERNLSQAQGLDVYKGTGEFTGPHTMIVRYTDGTQSEELTAERIVIAVGARSFVPSIQ
ncbi:MAG TPA: FAD-dependent oxidoreductase, partial [Clostridia bacterium]|nr:FAD-dependent oxidoreductase [Clostridia bacterium]